MWVWVWLGGWAFRRRDNPSQVDSSWEMRRLSHGAQSGALCVGGCCGITNTAPAHTRACGLRPHPLLLVVFDHVHEGALLPHIPG